MGVKETTLHIADESGMWKENLRGCTRKTKS